MASLNPGSTAQIAGPSILTAVLVFPCTNWRGWEMAYRHEVAIAD